MKIPKTAESYQSIVKKESNKETPEVIGVIAKIRQKLEHTLNQTLPRISSSVALTTILHLGVISALGPIRSIVDTKLEEQRAKVLKVENELSVIDKEEVNAELEYVEKINNPRIKNIKDRDRDYQKFLDVGKTLNLDEANWRELLVNKEYYLQGIEDEVVNKANSFYENQRTLLGKEKPKKLTAKLTEKLLRIFTPKKSGDETMASAMDSLALSCGNASQNCEARDRILIMIITDLFPELKNNLEIQFFDDHERLIITLEEGRFILDQGELINFPDAKTASRRNVTVKVKDYLANWLGQIGGEEYEKRGQVNGESTDKNKKPVISTNLDKKSMSPLVEKGSYKTAEEELTPEEKQQWLDYFKKQRDYNLKTLKKPFTFEVELIEPILSKEKLETTYREYQERGDSDAIVTFLEPKISTELAQEIADRFAFVSLHANLSWEEVDALLHGKKLKYLILNNNSLDKEVLGLLIGITHSLSKVDITFQKPFIITKYRASFLKDISHHVDFKSQSMSFEEGALDELENLYLQIDGKPSEALIREFKNFKKLKSLHLGFYTDDYDGRIFESLGNFSGELNIKFGRKPNPEIIKEIVKLKKIRSLSIDGNIAGLSEEFNKLNQNSYEYLTVKQDFSDSDFLDFNDNNLDLLLSSTKWLELSVTTAFVDLLDSDLLKKVNSKIQTLKIRDINYLTLDLLNNLSNFNRTLILEAKQFRGDSYKVLHDFKSKDVHIVLDNFDFIDRDPEAIEKELEEMARKIDNPKIKIIISPKIDNTIFVGVASINGGRIEVSKEQLASVKAQYANSPPKGGSVSITETED